MIIQIVSWKDLLVALHDDGTVWYRKYTDLPWQQMNNEYETYLPGHSTLTRSI